MTRSLQPPQTDTPPVKTREDPLVDRYVSEAFFSYSSTALTSALDLLQEIESSELRPGQPMDLQARISACKNAIETLQNTGKVCHKSQLASLNREIVGLQTQSDLLIDSVRERERPPTPDETYQSDLQNFFQAVESHIRNQRMIQAFNRGDTLPVAPQISMRYDIRQHFHGRPLNQRVEPEFVIPHRILHAGEVLGYYVTHNSRSPGIQFCISVHLWRIKRNARSDQLWKADGRLNEEFWEDQDRGLNTSYYVLHIPKP